MEKVVYKREDGGTETVMTTDDNKTVLVVRDKNGKIIESKVKK